MFGMDKAEIYPVMRCVSQHWNTRRESATNSLRLQRTSRITLVSTRTFTAFHPFPFGGFFVHIAGQDAHQTVREEGHGFLLGNQAGYLHTVFEDHDLAVFLGKLQEPAKVVLHLCGCCHRHGTHTPFAKIIIFYFSYFGKRKYMIGRDAPEFTNDTHDKPLE